MRKSREGNYKMPTNEDFQQVFTKVLIFSPCSRSKSDKVEITSSSKIEPQDYLESHELLERLKSTRKHILEELGAQKGDKTTYALDLYRGRAYREMRSGGNHAQLKQILLSGNNMQWFFLSGGYGVIHALEESKNYDATFSQKEANKKNIPFTGDIWREASLSRICDDIFRKFDPPRVYVFGNKDYTAFIKATNFWEERESGKRVVKMFETPYTRILTELVGALLHDDLDSFDDRHPGCYYGKKKQTNSTDEC